MHLVPQTYGELIRLIDQRVKVALEKTKTERKKSAVITPFTPKQMKIKQRIDEERLLKKLIETPV